MKQQQKMTEIMKTTFKELLAMPLTTVGRTLPSPEELKNKILVKGKRVKTHGIEHEEDEEEVDEEEPKDGKKASKAKKAGEEKESDTHPDLSAITFVATGKVKAFTQAVSDSIPADFMASYSETTTEKNVKKKSILQGWINHNRQHLRSTYYTNFGLLYVCTLYIFSVS